MRYDALAGRTPAPRFMRDSGDNPLGRYLAILLTELHVLVQSKFTDRKDRNHTRDLTPAKRSESDNDLLYGSNESIFKK